MDKPTLDIRDYYSAAEWIESINKTKYFLMKILDTGYFGMTEIEPDELVADAVSKLIEGVRAWDPDKRSLSNHLIHIVRSDLSHYAEKDKNHVSDSELDKHPGSNPSKGPAALAELKEELSHILDFISESKDSVVIKMVRSFGFDGLERHQNIHISEAIGESINEVTKAKKRLKTIVADYKISVKL